MCRQHHINKGINRLICRHIWPSAAGETLHTALGLPTRGRRKSPGSDRVTSKAQLCLASPASRQDLGEHHTIGPDTSLAAQHPPLSAPHHRLSWVPFPAESRLRHSLGYMAVQGGKEGRKREFSLQFSSSLYFFPAHGSNCFRNYGFLQEDMDVYC